MAVFDMGSTKAPGEDGFLRLFYQKCWHIIGDEVTDFCLHLLNGDMKVRSLNFTNIVLIPKNSSPSNMIHFRPISLCNVLYKILAKTLANRFRRVIEKCIEAAQSAFVLESLISDNVLLAYEILNTLKRKRMGKKGFMAVKLDISKAYDRVEWEFIKHIMIQMGFANRWVKAIMQCVHCFLFSGHERTSRREISTDQRTSSM
ncbi:hypothetical protein PVK06_003135 [Gossypium arboreum]|uniref:Reverse transcriptase domain-containing protein n=1 Tax=Gossypium arboreum TaxID=29729 RepID=A0ABR0R5D8_GOSAR|nr:hypothetical protein PVK06_003135 [Gossypium arboreum]